MSSERETLAEYVKRVRREKRLSLTEVYKQSGKAIARSHVGRIENNQAGNLSIESLRALARGLQVPEEEIFAVARGKLPTLTGRAGDDKRALRELMLFYFDHVPEECQLDMLASAKGIYERRNKSDKIHERASARAATRKMLDEEVAEHVAPKRKSEVAATLPQQQAGSSKSSESRDEKLDEGEDSLRKAS